MRNLAVIDIGSNSVRLLLRADGGEKQMLETTRLGQGVAERMLQPDKGDDSPGGLSRIAIIHIDGNGVGAIMRDLAAAMHRIPPADFEQAVECGPDDADALRDAYALSWAAVDELVDENGAEAAGALVEQLWTTPAEQLGGAADPLPRWCAANSS